MMADRPELLSSAKDEFNVFVKNCVHAILQDGCSIIGLDAHV